MCIRDRVGDKYELFYFSADGWKSLGVKVAEEPKLIYNNVPSHACLLYTSKVSAVSGSSSAQSAASNAASVTGVPVSYTHLDVYKRQAFAQLIIRPTP